MRPEVRNGARRVSGYGSALRCIVQVRSTLGVEKHPEVITPGPSQKYASSAMRTRYLWTNRIIGHIAAEEILLTARSPAGAETFTNFLLPYRHPRIALYPSSVTRL